MTVLGVKGGGLDGVAGGGVWAEWKGGVVWGGVGSAAEWVWRSGLAAEGQREWII